MRQDVLETADLVGLILVFVTTFFGLRYPTIVANLGEDEPTGLLKRKRMRSRLVGSLLSDCLPPMFVNAASTYILSPLAFRIARYSRLTLWDFDIALTAYMFIQIWVAVFLVWSIVLSIAMVRKIRSLDRGIHS